MDCEALQVLYELCFNSFNILPGQLDSRLLSFWLCSPLSPSWKWLTIACVHYISDTALPFSALTAAIIADRDHFGGSQSSPAARSLRLQLRRVLKYFVGVWCLLSDCSALLPRMKVKHWILVHWCVSVLLFFRWWSAMETMTLCQVLKGASITWDLWATKADLLAEWKK